MSYRNSGRFRLSLISNYGRLIENPDRVTDYIYLGDQRVAAITDGAVNYYHADHLGGSNVITNASGVMKELTEYDPYGKYSRQESYGTAEEKAFRYFTGKEYDVESELYYYGARYYDPGLGRFITADTIVKHSFDPQDLNRYSYVRNNPVNLVDRDGHFWGAIVALFKAVVGFAAAHPVIFTGLTTAAINVGSNISAIQGFADVAKFAAIGYVSGAATAGSGLGVGRFLGPKIGTFLRGTIMALAGGASGGLISGTGNSLATGSGLSSALRDGLNMASISAATAVTFHVTYYGASKVAEGIGNALKANNSVGVKTPSGTQSNTVERSSNVDLKGEIFDEQVQKGVVVSSFDDEGNLLGSSSKFGSVDFVGDSSGQVFPVPKGATGPKPLPSGKETGIIFNGGMGGANGQVENMRIMDPRPATGNAPAYPNGLIIYSNSREQPVDPYTGKTVSRPEGHHPINK